VTSPPEGDLPPKYEELAMDAPPEYDENTMTINPNNLSEDETIPAEPRPTSCDHSDPHPSGKNYDEPGLERPSNSKESHSHSDAGTQSSIETKHTGGSRGSEICQ
jgi:hypothetical protein